MLFLLKSKLNWESDLKILFYIIYYKGTLSDWRLFFYDDFVSHICLRKLTHFQIFKLSFKLLNHQITAPYIAVVKSA